VRTGFRLPPLFTGRAADYNYATAVVAYMVAEEQVFQPERAEFDATMNSTIMKALGCTDILMKSNGITLKNVDSQIKGLTLAKDLSDGATFVKEVNQISGTNLKYDPNAAPDRVTITEAMVPGQNPVTPNQAPGKPTPTEGKATAAAQAKAATPAKASGKPTAPANGKDTATATTTAGKAPGKAKKGGGELLQLAMDYAGVRGTIALKHELSDAEKSEVLAEVDDLEGDEKHAFYSMVAALSFGGSTPDLIHLAECNHVH
jgi:hypothetical protein